MFEMNMFEMNVKIVYQRTGDFRFMDYGFRKYFHLNSLQLIRMFEMCIGIVY